MLESLAALARHHVILASASPRRLELLRQIGIRNIHVQPSKFAEDLDKRFCTGVEYALETAKHKALDVAESSCEAFVIAADTVRLCRARNAVRLSWSGASVDECEVQVVEVEGEILEKPADAADAKRMLTRLSNRSHQVHTGKNAAVSSTRQSGWRRAILCSADRIHTPQALP